MLSKEYFSSLEQRLAQLPGKVSMFYTCPDQNESFSYQADIPLIAASVIKLPMMITLFRLVKEGKADWNERFTVTSEVKVPSCGALTYLHDGLQVTLRDLCTLMIILSDNTATNMVFDRIGNEEVNKALRALQCETTTLRRKMFDSVSSAKGIQNHITAGEIGHLLLMMMQEKCISPDTDHEMIQILLDQRLNGKIPFFLHAIDIDVAHKTGEDSGTTHDVAIVMTKTPFVLCFASNDTDVARFERLMQDIALELAVANNQ